MKKLSVYFFMFTVFILLLTTISWVVSASFYETLYKFLIICILALVGSIIVHYHLEQKLKTYGAECARIAVEDLIKKIDKDSFYYDKAEKDFNRTMLFYCKDLSDLDDVYYRKSQFFSGSYGDPLYHPPGIESNSINMIFSETIVYIKFLVVLLIVLSCIIVLNY